jgi:phosphohistidine swiveling domain-containing protein
MSSPATPAGKPSAPGKRYVARSKQVAARRLGDEVMIMVGSEATVYTLNEVAAAIWEEADGVTPLDEIVQRRICREFDVAPAAALEDALALVEELAGHGVLIVSDAPIAQKNPPAAPEKEPG